VGNHFRVHAILSNVLCDMRVVVSKVMGKEGNRDGINAERKARKMPRMHWKGQENTISVPDVIKFLHL